MVSKCVITCYENVNIKTIQRLTFYEETKAVFYEMLLEILQRKQIFKIQTVF